MIPVDYVSYIDECELSVSLYDLAVGYYPDRLTAVSALGSSGESAFTSTVEPYGNGIYLYSLTDNVVVVEGQRLQIYALRCVKFDSAEISDAVTAYYFYHPSIIASLPPTLSIVPQSMIDSINSGSNPLEDPFLNYNDSGDLAYNQNSIFSWLYNLGANIVTNDLITDLLSFQVGDYNLISLLIQGGFMVYVGWVITKWVIP